MDLLPQSDGLLKWFLLYTSISAAIHSVTTYVNPIPSMVPFQGPNAPPRSALQAHLYGIKNCYTALIRMYAAYNLHKSRELYVLAMWTFAGVLFLYITELLLWQTVRLREAFIALVTAAAGLVWMWVQFDHYVPSG
ncbi:uncharacterized protein HMPREF1541_04662 [Cyphellophora europaea CBS 101466]|uniref:Ergosterol biosynthesis protein Erg28 n=1 Tax=Cyphellophora europaea (strain CBS 101466) TaxID=1220924 RepID=W2RVR4_CYPE1|nr:uncharacterized protein HMPREF1541_04662 [Cyphellophora europaea CBS 101466]ETN40385.1 hypothetical protein HMPREF1541_04662 [Cyphellophora europaea CBS 101466]